MPKTWERRDDGVTYSVRLGSNQRLEFESRGPGVVHSRGGETSDGIWVEEFPDSERWKDWVRQKFGPEALEQIREAVTAELETLYADRQETFRIASEALGSDEPQRRRESIDRLRSLAARYEDLVQPAIEFFSRLLEEGDDETRRQVAEAIRRLAETHPESVAGVRDELRRALNDDHPNVRLDAARSLVVTAGEESTELLAAVVDSLVGLLHEQKRWFSQGPVAGLLGDLGRTHPGALAPAVEPLAGFIRGELRGGSSTSGIGRSSAVQALSEIGMREFEMIEEYVEVFFEQIDASRPGVRGRCAEALGMVGAERDDLARRAAGVLAERLDDTEFVRAEAEDALRRIYAENPDPVEDVLDEPATILDTDDDFTP